ncbi:hypothetical protein ACN28S_41975 [Cystobacter fuscus]
MASAHASSQREASAAEPRRESSAAPRVVSSAMMTQVASTAVAAGPRPSGSRCRSAFSAVSRRAISWNRAVSATSWGMASSPASMHSS